MIAAATNAKPKLSKQYQIDVVMIWRCCIYTSIPFFITHDTQNFFLRLYIMISELAFSQIVLWHLFVMGISLASQPQRWYLFFGVILLAILNSIEYFVFRHLGFGILISVLVFVIGGYTVASIYKKNRKKPPQLSSMGNTMNKATNNGRLNY